MNSEQETMNNNRIKKIIFSSLASFFLLLASSAHAVCPVCTVAVGAGVGLSRYFGIEDTITGVWIGGLIVSLALWTDNWLLSRGKKIKYQKIISLLAYYLIIILPIYWKGIIGHTYNKLCGIDKLILGIIAGSIGFWAGSVLHLYLKKRNSEKVYFPFQKVAFGVAPLIILSVVFYIISKC